MKWCLSSRQTNEYLSKADEIKVQYRDRNVIYDLREKYKKATIILQMPFDKETVVNWNEISTFNVYTEHNFILCFIIQLMFKSARKKKLNSILASLWLASMN